MFLESCRPGATQGQMDGFSSQLPYKMPPRRGASVGDCLKICPQLDSRVVGERVVHRWSPAWLSGVARCHLNQTEERLVDRMAARRVVVCPHFPHPLHHSSRTPPKPPGTPVPSHPDSLASPPNQVSYAPHATPPTELAGRLHGEQVEFSTHRRQPTAAGVSTHCLPSAKSFAASLGSSI